MRAELGMCPLQTQKLTKIEMAKQRENHAKGEIDSHRALVERAIWEKVREGQDGIWWDSAVEKVWQK